MRESASQLLTSDNWKTVGDGLQKRSEELGIIAKVSGLFALGARNAEIKVAMATTAAQAAALEAMAKKSAELAQQMEAAARAREEAEAQERDKQREAREREARRERELQSAIDRAGRDYNDRVRSGEELHNYRDTPTTENEHAHDHDA